MPATTITFAVSFDGAPESPIELLSYLFDDAGKLVASAPVRDGKTVLEASPQRLQNARLFIAPAAAKLPAAPSIEALKQAGAFEPGLHLQPQLRAYKLPAIVPELWRRWLLCICHIPGRVVRPVEISGHTYDLPVRHARVHLCEVDRWPVLFARIPDPLILRIRDELLRARPQPPTPPEPPVAILKPLPVGLRLSMQAFSQSESLNRISGLELSPERLNELADAQPELVAVAMQATTPTPAELPAPVLTALASTSAAAVREAFSHHIEALLPWFCLTPRLWPFLHSNEVFSALTDEQGRFDARIPYPCRGDRPDIYVWVEYCIGGVWTAVYKPPMVCTTRWNYPSNQELVVRIRDPRVPWQGGPPAMQATQIGVITIGNAVNVSQIDGDGLAPGGRPLGGSLEPTVWFGPGLQAAGITHYRWSYRRLSDAGAALEDWHACDGFVGRHYAVITPDNHLVFKVFKVGPDEALPATTLYRIPPKDPPMGSWAPQINARSNTASGYFVTGQPAGRVVPDGLYQLKLELFRSAGAAIAPASGLDFRVPPPGLGAPFAPEAEVPFQPAAEANLIRDGAGQVTAFTLRLRVDNSPCTAGIYAVTVPGSTQECGFLSYPLPATSALLRFVASHPRGYGDFDFSLLRGSCAVAAAAASGKTGSAPVNGYVLDPTLAYGRSFAIDSLLAPLPGPPGCAQLCKRGAFAQHLHVYARATDGWSRLDYLDAHAVTSFALAPHE